jgi:hypothetical protein
MKLNFIHNKNFIKIAIGLIVVIIIALIGFNFGSIIEGYSPSPKTLCYNIHDCATCVNHMEYQTENPTQCLWNNEQQKCGDMPGPGWSRFCGATPTPTPSTKCSNVKTKTGCNSTDGCTWNGNQCVPNINPIPGFDKCTSHSTCATCTTDVENQCKWSKTKGCAGPAMSNQYPLDFSKMCKDPIAPSQEKCAKHMICSNCVKDGCLWSKENGACGSPDDPSVNSDTTYTKKCSSVDPNMPDDWDPSSNMGYYELQTPVYVKL